MFPKNNNDFLLHEIRRFTEAIMAYKFVKWCNLTYPWEKNKVNLVHIETNKFAIGRYASTFSAMLF